MRGIIAVITSSILAAVLPCILLAQDRPSGPATLSGPIGGLTVGTDAQNGLLRSSVVTIVPDQLFAGTLLGQRLTAQLEAQGTELALENRRIEEALEEEESLLTAQRKTLSSEEFTSLADAFDAKVQATRAEQDEKARQLTQASSEAEQQFLQAVVPVINVMMSEIGAVVVLDRRSAFISLDASDITTAAIARIDAVLGDGVRQEDPPE